MGTIKSFKKFIEESIWSDIQDRSSGDVVRKEDDINTLDLNEFYAYIKDQYKTKVEYIDLDAMGGENGDVLGVDITENVILFYKPKRGHILLSWSRVKIPMPFFDELIGRFKIKNPHDRRKIITEKDGSCTNKTFIDAIDFFLEHKESMMNESIWSDIQDRSAGKTVRKEDERHKILERLLATYIKLFAESCYYHDEYTSGSYPDFRAYIKDFRDNPRIEEVCPNDSYFDDLLDYVNKETWNNQIYDTIVEISHRIAKGEHPITDDVIEELRKHNVNESIWSDIQDRSAGKTVRKEDLITTNEDLKNKIWELYKEQGEGETLDVSSLTNRIKCDDFSNIFSGYTEVKYIIGLEDWDVSNVRNMSGMFMGCEKFNSDLSNWDVSSVGDMRFMFDDCKTFNCDLSKWDVSSVEYMTSMFWGCENFNSNLSKWNVRRVGDMRCMFNGCENFNSDLSDWDVSSVKYMINIFKNCKSLEQIPSWYMKKQSKITESIWSDIQDRSAGDTVRKEDMITTNEELKNKIWELYIEQGEGDTLDVSSLTNCIKCDDFSNIFSGLKEVKYIIGLEDWDVSNVKDMSGMFMGCKKFNSDLSKWDVSEVTDMKGMFEDCENFNSDLSKWDVSKVTNMGFMFDDCKTFNCDLSKWDVSSVEHMGSMFWNCKNFNSDLSNWDVSSVKNMDCMFYSCKNFNSDLSKWDVSSVKNMEYMFYNCYNFNSDLSKWNVRGYRKLRSMFNKCKSLEQIPSWYINESFIKSSSDFLNESIWSDIQDRSAGDTVRKEDISEEDKKEIDYIFNGFAYLIVFTYYEPTIDDFIKMMKEAYPDKDNSKYIAWVKSNWDKKYKDELDKKIQYYKTYIDKKINRYLNHFVAQIVYCEKYNVSLPDIKKFAGEVYKNGGMPLEMSSVGEIDVNESWYDIFKKYVDENWNDVKKRINDFIVEENQKIAKTGFKKTPGKKICDILDEWWYSLGDEKEDIAWDEFGERAEDKYYEEHDPEYNEYTGEDFEADDEWSNASWIESVEIYMKYNQKTNESIWSDIQDRSSGDTVRKEDEMTYDDFIMLRATAKMFRVGVRNYSNPKKRKYTPKRIDGCDGFIDYILEKKKEHFWNDTPDETYDKAINFVKNNWGDCTGIQEFIDKCLNNINECDGVPGGLTPADVGGMGPAYFPGPNGEPGSGDLPSPTGIVYKQVAPFDTFIKIRKQKKKKKKKFRIEDEPCAHSKNPKIYDHVDDFRDYVDRVYSKIDKRK